METSSKIAWWALATLQCQAACLVAIGVLYTASGDICDPLHESPNTPLGWTVAGLAMALPIVFAAWFRARLVLALSGVSVAPLFLFWLWWLLPAGHC